MLRTLMFIFCVQVSQVGQSIIPYLLDWGWGGGGGGGGQWGKKFPERKSQRFFEKSAIRHFYLTLFPLSLSESKDSLNARLLLITASFKL